MYAVLINHAAVFSQNAWTKIVDNNLKPIAATNKARLNALGKCIFYCFKIMKVYKNYENLGEEQAPANDKIEDGVDQYKAKAIVV